MTLPLRAKVGGHFWKYQRLLVDCDIQGHIIWFLHSLHFIGVWRRDWACDAFVIDITHKHLHCFFIQKKRDSLFGSATTCIASEKRSLIKRFASYMRSIPTTLHCITYCFLGGLTWVHSRRTTLWEATHHYSRLDRLIIKSTFLTPVLSFFWAAFPFPFPFFKSPYISSLVLHAQQIQMHMI